MPERDRAILAINADISNAYRLENKHPLTNLLFGEI